MTPQLKSLPRFLAYLICCFGLLSMYACQEKVLTEDIEIATETNTDESTLLKSLMPRDILEHRMQWASFLTARILCSNVEARIEVKELMKTRGSYTIGLDQLLLNGVEAPTFYELFVEDANAFLVQIDGNPKPTHNQLVPPSSRQQDLLTAYDFIDYLTIDNCTELFFPNGLDETAANIYYTTAHPLTLEDSNYGFEITCAELGGFGSSHTGSREVTVSPSLVVAGHEIIVCRPYRITEDPNCNYSKMESIDFTLFLND